MKHKKQIDNIFDSNLKFYKKHTGNPDKIIIWLNKDITKIWIFIMI